METGFNVHEVIKLMCTNLVEYAIAKKKAADNPDPFSCCGCLVESCIWGVACYRNRNLKKFCLFIFYFISFFVLTFILS
jgi:hypothetical protein